jgi:glutaredoxin 3
MKISIRFQLIVRFVLMLLLHHAMPVIPFGPRTIGLAIRNNKNTILLAESKNEKDKGDLFLSQLAGNLNKGCPDLLQPPLIPLEDTKSKMRKWAGEYNSEALRARLQNRIDNYPVFLLIFETCPYCEKVLTILKDKSIDPKATKIVELDSLGVEKYAIRSEVIEMVNQTSIPALWIGGEFIGGSEELIKLEKSGELDTRLEKAHALVVSLS